MLGKMDTDHIPVNNYYLEVIGAFTFYATTVSGIEVEAVTNEMPDRTVVASGIKKATEITITIPMHHYAEQAAIELWWASCQDPVAADYKKAMVLQHMSINGSSYFQFTLDGVFPIKRKLPDLDLGDDGELAQIEWTFSVDTVSVG